MNDIERIDRLVVFINSRVDFPTQTDKKERNSIEFELTLRVKDTFLTSRIVNSISSYQ